MKIMKYLSMSLIFLPLFLFRTTAFGQGVVQDELEKAALLALYNSTDGENWTGNKWTVEDIEKYPIVSLAGVTITSGDITSINIQGAGLNGPLPSQINDLTQLTFLSLYNNSLSGTIPDLSGLTKLQTLNLGYNFFTGSIPLWIGNLTNLKLLNLSSKQTGGIKLSGPVPANISLLENLETLNLRNNDLSMAGAIPSTFSNLDKLHTLDLHSCQLQVSSINDEFQGLNSLNSLNLSNNPSLNVNGVFPDILVNLPSLTTLTLQQNTFNRFPATFDELSNLNWLDLSFNNYSDATRLSSLIDTLKNVLSLKTLILINCQINSLPPDFDHLSTVETLYLSNNNLNPAQCDIIGDMDSLTTLHVSNCNLITLPQNIKNSTTLRTLNASNNQLSNVPAILKEIPDLRDLNLSNNGIEILPVWFGTETMISLEKLNLNHNQLETLPQNFSQLTNLVELRINNNNLNGTWPATFSALNKIETLDLSFNDITDLPDMNSWAFLKNVNLEKNKLSGTVPDFLTNVTSLKTNINIKNNAYSNFTGNAHFSLSSPTVSIGINQFTFEQVIKINPSPGPYHYDPQDSVDIKREVSAFVNGTLTLVAHVDTATSLNSKFQWFKFIDGINDIPLNSSPNHQLKEYTFAVPASEEGSKYYYKITHSSAPKLVLNSRLQNLIFNCDVPPSKVDFEISKQLCAVKFVPDIEYSVRCRTTFYSWDFGDGKTSLEKSPLHVYASSGTYNVTLEMRYSCFPCKGDTTITKSITYDPSDLILKDSLISITTDIKHQVLATAASTFSDAWPLEHNIDISSENPYEQGAEGVWRNDASFAYNVPRDTSLSLNLNLSKDGTFDLSHFNWETAEMEAVPNWIKTNNMTQYSPYSYELENRDVMGIYSSALYGYGEQLPTANGANMRHQEMAFTSFEYLDKKASGNWVFGTDPIPNYTTYDVIVANDHVALIDATMAELGNVGIVDVAGSAINSIKFRSFSINKVVKNCEIVCMQAYSANPEWTIIVLRKPPFPYLWNGKIKVKNAKTPAVIADLDPTFAHSGKSSLKITSAKTFKQELLTLDTGKTYLISAWVSVNDQHLSTPKLADDIGIEVIYKDKNGVVQSVNSFEPSGNIIEGWQQLKGTFTHPDYDYLMELKFKPGSKGTAWYDDLRLHPENGNMQSYVYDLSNYRLQAIHDEENFASFYYYDEEGNLHLVKKETEKGIKTITETVSYKKQN